MKQSVPHFLVRSILILLVAFLTACTAIRPDGASPALTIPDSSAPAETDVSAALNQRQVLALQLGLDLNAVEIVAVEPVTWPDACLGKPDPAELCAPGETPGYRITLAANGGEYTYHTDEEGAQVRLAAAPEPRPEGPHGEQILSWMYTDGEGVCREARFGADGVAFGRCGGVQMGAPFALEQRQADLTGFAGEFASFEADTAAGAVRFTGYGAKKATPAQQRMIAEWANLVQLEAQAGRSGASWGLAFAWHREGGAAGFCDDVTVYVTGEVYASSCRGQQPEDLAHFRLDAGQLATLFEWIDAYAPFEYSWTQPEQADAVTVTLVFSGAGEQEAMTPDQALIVDFAQNLFNEGSMATREAPAACVQSDEGRQLLIQEEYGYCLLYPSAYSLWQLSAGTMEIISGTIMNHIDPRASISVEAASGRTLDEVVAQLLADYAPPGFDVEPQTITVDGVEATLIDELPAQDFTRRVVLVHNDRLYSFFFAPIGEEGTATRQQAEALYQTVIESFRLLDGPSGSIERRESSESMLRAELDISLDPAIANEIEEQFSKDMDNELWQVQEPGFTVYTLKGYPLENRAGQLVVEPQIFIYRLHDLEGVSQHSADNIANLRRLVQSKLAMGAYPAAGVDEPPAHVPWLHPINATPMMHAGVEYLNFQNGAGMRYLTQYAQALSVVNNEELTYTFQGLTQDGKYYIAAVLPVHHPDLLAGAYDAPDGDPSVWADIEKNLQYMRKMVQLLDEAEPASFTPDLTTLDVLIRSISIR